MSTAAKAESIYETAFAALADQAIKFYADILKASMPKQKIYKTDLRMKGLKLLQGAGQNVLRYPI